MNKDYTANDYIWIKELMSYAQTLEERLAFFEDTSQIDIPEAPIERVIFQDRAKGAIRKIAQNKGHILMVGKPGTGKSMLTNMFNEVLDRSLGDYLRPNQSIVAYPGKDKNHVRIAYENPEKVDGFIAKLFKDIEHVRESVLPFSLSDQITSVKKAKHSSFG